MKPKAAIRKTVETVTGTAIGAAIAGPLGAVVGGLVARHVESSLEAPLRTDVAEAPQQDPVAHARCKRILVPLDFSDSSQQAVRFAKEWVEMFGSEVCLLHVVDPTAAVAKFGPVPMGAPEGDLAGQARSALEELSRAHFAASARVAVEVRMGVPSDQIGTAARDLKSDVIIITTHGRSGLAHALIGSTAERVVRHAPCPVLTLRTRSKNCSTP